MNNKLRAAVVTAFASGLALVSSGAAMAAEAEGGPAQAENNTVANQLGLVNAVVPVGNVLTGGAVAVDEVDVDVLSD